MYVKELNKFCLHEQWKKKNKKPIYTIMNFEKTNWKLSRIIIFVCKSIVLPLNFLFISLYFEYCF